MTLKLKISAVLFGAHLLLSGLYAAHCGDWELDTRVGRLFYFWGEFTGSSNIYSFFAPRVGDQSSVLYTLVDSTGKQNPWMLEGNTHEVSTRVATVYNFVRLPEAGELFCRSFGNNALRMHPDARVVRVCVIQQTMPTMQAFREASTLPIWEPIEAHDYVRQDTLP